MPGTCIVHFLQRAKQDKSAKRNTRYAGIILFGTGGGASRYDGKSFRNFTTKEGLSNNDLTTIMEDKTGNLVVTLHVEEGWKQLKNKKNVLHSGLYESCH
jgi:hypothetical protein